MKIIKQMFAPMKKDTIRVIICDQAGKVEGFEDEWLGSEDGRIIGSIASGLYEKAKKSKDLKKENK